MDRLLNGETENHLDTDWTLAPENKKKNERKKKKLPKQQLP